MFYHHMVGRGAEAPRWWVSHVNRDRWCRDLDTDNLPDTHRTLEQLSHNTGEYGIPKPFYLLLLV